MSTNRTRIPTNIVDNPRLDAALAAPPPSLPAVREVVTEPMNETSAAYADAWRAAMQTHGARAYIHTANIRASADFPLTTPGTTSIRHVFGEDADVHTIQRQLRHDIPALRDYEAAIETLLATWACDQRIRLSAQRAADYLAQRDEHLKGDAEPTELP